MARIGSRPIDELIVSAIQGDGPAFTALWDTYIDDLRSFIRGMMKNRDALVIDDICSRSFEKAFRQIGNYDPSRSQFFTWLRVIARNTALDFVEQEKRVHPQNRVVYLDDDSSLCSDLVDNIDDLSDTPLDSIIKTEDEAVKEGYIGHLPELYREVARLRLLEGMQYKEIAEVLGMELNTVRTRIRRARTLIEKMNDGQV